MSKDNQGFIPMEENVGYIKLYRKLLTSQVFVNPTKLKIWIWIILKANFKNKHVPVKTGKGVTEVQVLRGQFIFGRNKAAEELNINSHTIYYNIKKLEEIGMISRESHSHYSIITICNYEEYQGQSDAAIPTNAQPMHNQITTKPQAANTTNKDKNDKNVEEETGYSKFLERFNAITGKIYTGDDTGKTQYQELLKRGYKLPDFEKSIRNCLNNKWHQMNKNVLTPSFITKPEQFEKYLNSPVDSFDLPSHLDKMVY